MLFCGENNTIIPQTNTSATPIYDTWTFVGDLTEVNTATFASEARFNLSNAGGYSANFQPSTTSGFVGTLNVSTVNTGAFWAPAMGSYNVETFESFDDAAGVDATWTDVSFDLTGPATSIELGEFAAGTSFLFDTEGSGFDTELGGLTGAGLFLASDDDGGTGTVSSLNLGVLGTGDYYLALGGFNTVFNNYVVTGGAATGAYNVYLNGGSIAAGTLAGGVQLVHFSVAIPEPGSISILFGIGMCFVARRRR